MRFKITNIFFLILGCFFLFALGPVYADDNIQYCSHVENIGWTSYCDQGQTSGTTGRGLQIEALRIRIPGNAGGIQYNTHVENIGWMTPVKNDEVSGTTGKNLQIEAVNMVLDGEIAARNDLYYRVHVSDIGWMDWAKNGDPAGTTGQNKAVEAIEIVLRPKGSPAPGATDNSYNDANNAKAQGPSVHGALKVEGSRLTDQSGNAVQLKGVSTHGLAWYPQYVNQTLFNELKNNWNANVVRLALYTAESGGYCTGGDQNALKALVKSGIDYATKADLYAIVDWHVLSEGDPAVYKEQAKSFFNEISSSYKDNNNVLYEICNEPNGSASWEGIKSYAAEIIPIIRANDSDAVIIVGTPTWSQRVDEALASPISGFPNLMYSFHFYAGTHKDDLRNRVAEAHDKGLPIFVSEFGICDASGNGALDLDSAGKWMDLINRDKISYVAWNLSNKNESSALIGSGCSKVSGFTKDDLSPSGKWLLEKLSSTGLIGGSENPSTPSPEPQSGLELKVDQVNTWSDGTSSYYQYNVTFVNNGSTSVNGWKEQINFNQTVELSQFWNFRPSVRENTLTLENVDFNAQIQPSGQTEVGFIVKSGPDLKIL